MIPYGRQSIDEEDVRAVTNVLRSDFLTQGPTVPQFELAIADCCRAAHAVAVSSATAALHIACLALDVGPGDVVWTSPNTFVASANCARYCGARIDFVDIDPITYNLSTEALARKLEKAETNGVLPKVVIPVHFAGTPCEMVEIQRLAKKYRFSVIEDASHALGAHYRDSTIGDCSYSDITVFSFHPVKIITTAEGGIATTQSQALARRMRMLRSHGITRDRNELVNQDEGPWYYEQHYLGFNYRMTELQAALGLSQLRHLDEWLARRQAIAAEYDRALAPFPLVLPCRPGSVCSAMHLYVVQLDKARTNIGRRTAFERLRAAGVGVQVHYIPVHIQPDFQKLGFRKGQFVQSESYYERCISLPIYPGLSHSEQHFVVRALEKAFD